MSTQNNNSQHSEDMIQRKLSGVVATLSIDIPWEIFDDQVTSVRDFLESHHNVSLPHSVIADNPQIYAMFEKSLESWMDEYVNDYMEEIYLDYASAGRKIFAAEIRTQVELDRKRKEEEDRLAKIQKEEAKKKAAEQKAKAESEGVSILVNKKNAEKAQAILRAAGLLG